MKKLKACCTLLILLLHLCQPSFSQTDFPVSIHTEAGKLMDLLGNKIDSVTNLTLVGQINGNDVATIRKMKSLTSINMENVAIVEGGMFTAEYINISTEKDKIPPYMLASIANITSISIPNSAIAIGDSAFYNCTGLISIKIPNHVTTIGAAAFTRSSGITVIEIPESVTHIGDLAFNGCKALQEFIVSENNRVYCSIDKVLFSKDKTKLISYPNSKSSSYIIPNYVTSIEDNAFRSCIGLTYLEIPNNVVSIGNFAMMGCSGITSITIPGNIKSISDYTFSHCSGLESIHLPDGIKSIGKNAFALCSNLESFIIPDSLVTIDDGTFYCCTTLQSINIPDKVTSIGTTAFYRCSGLKSITLPNSVLFIGPQAFTECSSVSEFKVAEDNQAFSSENGVLFNKDKTTLISYPISGPRFYSIPNSVDSIGYMAFAYCTELDSVNIPNGVKSIGVYSFWYCPSLSKFELPNSVSSLGLSIVTKTDNIKDIICKAETPPATDISITSIDKRNCILYIPKGSLEAYRNADEWKDFETIVECTYTYLINASSSEGGNIEGVLSSVNQGESVTINIIPNQGFKIAEAFVNEKDITAEISNNMYTLPPVFEDISISVTFKGIETGIDALDKNDIYVYTENGTIIVYGAKSGERVSVYNLGGALIYSSLISSNAERIQLSIGHIYIVAIGNKSIKVKL